MVGIPAVLTRLRARAKRGGASRRGPRPPIPPPARLFTARRTVLATRRTCASAVGLLPPNGRRASPRRRESKLRDDSARAIATLLAPRLRRPAPHRALAASAKDFAWPPLFL